jgi:solute carrier family 39 (zinc transporter), member 1/2/3
MISLDLHYIAVVTVFLCGLFGTFGAYNYGHHSKVLMTSVIKMFSAGVILSLALVHISNEVVTELKKVVEYPLGGVSILFGIILMSIIEHISHSWNKNDDTHHSNDLTIVDIEAPFYIDTCCEHTECNMNEATDEHKHSCITNLNSKSFASVATDKIMKKRFMLYVFEFACVFHSFIIGVGLGVTTNKSTLITLMVALSVHQFLEGVSLGFVVSDAKLSTIKSLIFVVSYSVTTPIGICIGTTLHHIYSNISKTQIIAQGSLQGISAGMLIYIALIQIIAEEFSKVELHGNVKLQQKLCMYSALVMGAICMCIMALWL